MALGRLLLDPWTFSPDEWVGLSPAAVANDEPQAKRARRHALRAETERWRREQNERASDV